MVKKFTSSLAGASLLLTLLLLIGRGFGFLREVIFADYFGSGMNFEIYLVGAVIPVTINAIVFYIAQNFFIPVYTDIKDKDIQKAKDLTNQYFWLFFFAGIVFVILLLPLSELLVKFYLGDVSKEVLKTAHIIFVIMLFTIPLNSGFSILANYLNAEFKYVHPAISQLYLNLSVILLIILLHTRIGIYVIPIGILSGYFLQLLYVIVFAKLNYKFNYSHLKTYFTKSGNYKTTLVMVILIEGINQLYVIVDRYYFNKVDAGGLASLNYSMNLYVLPLSIISMAFATVIFPKFSQSISQNNINELESNFNKGLIINAIIFVPIVILFLFDGNTLIKIIYERGKFNSIDTIRAFQILQIYSISLLFYSSFAIINKIIYGFKEVRYLLVVSILCILLKIVLNTILVGGLHQNGLAISTSLSYILMSVLGYYFVKRKINLKSTVLLGKYFFYLIIIGVFALIVNSILQLKSGLSLIIFIAMYSVSVLFLLRSNISNQFRSEKTL
jgi:putative peptidoglycan lipid II flippase